MKMDYEHYKLKCRDRDWLVCEILKLRQKLEKANKAIEEYGKIIENLKVKRQ